MGFDSLDTLNEEELLVLYANGDPDAARVLSGRLTPRLLSYAARLLGERNAAEDVVQETMLRLWRIAPDWRRGVAKPSTWAFRVASNLCTDRLRKRSSVPLEDAPEIADDSPSPEDTLMRQTRARALYDALAQLPDRQRRAVVLRHIEGMTNPDIAAILDLSVEAVESLTARGKRALNTALHVRKEELGL